MATRTLFVSFGRNVAASPTNAVELATASGDLPYIIALDDAGTNKDSSFSGPLPDLVLAPYSTLTLMVGYGGGSNDAITIGQSFVTTTPELDPSLVQSQPVGPFMYVPGPES